MKILLDENLPQNLKLNFGNLYEIFSVRDLGWSGKKNGELLSLLIQNGFEVFITIDKNLPHQQNLERFPIHIFIINAKNNKVQTLQLFVVKIKDLLHSLPKNRLVIVNL